MRPLLQPVTPSIEDPLELLKACHDKVRRFSALVPRLRDHLARHGPDAQAQEAAGLYRDSRLLMLVLERIRPPPVVTDAAATRAPTMTILEESMVGRMHLGVSELDLAATVRAVPAETEVEIETPVIAEAQLPLARRAQHAARAAQRFFDAHFS